MLQVLDIKFDYILVKSKKSIITGQIKGNKQGNKSSMGFHRTALILTIRIDWGTVKDGTAAYKHAAIDSGIFGIRIIFFKY